MDLSSSFQKTETPNINALACYKAEIENMQSPTSYYQHENTYLLISASLHESKLNNRP